MKNKEEAMLEHLRNKFSPFRVEMNFLERRYTIYCGTIKFPMMYCMTFESLFTTTNLDAFINLIMKQIEHSGERAMMERRFESVYEQSKKRDENEYVISMDTGIKPDCAILMIHPGDYHKLLRQGHVSFETLNEKKKKMNWQDIVEKI